MLSFFVLLFGLVFPGEGIAQLVDGRVVNSKTGEALIYVNIGVLNQARGTVSDERGYFSFDLGERVAEDTIRLSLIGFETKDYRVAAFIQVCENNGEIALEAKNYSLREVLVTPKDYKEKIVGNRVKSKAMSAGFQNNDLGHEMGIRMKVKKKPCYIEEIYINVARCEYDSVFYRLNLYEMDQKTPGKTILQEPIYLSYAREELTEELVVDLRPYYLYVESDFLVSLEIVKDLGIQGLYLNAGLFNNKTYFRKTSQSRWFNVGGIGISIAAKIKQEQ